MVLFPLWDLDLIQASDPPFRRKVVGPRSNSVVHHYQVLAGGEIGSLARVDYFFARPHWKTVWALPLEKLCGGQFTRQ